MIDKMKTGTLDSPTLRKKEVAELPSVQDSDRITDPGARSYAARVQERAAIKKSSDLLKGKSPPLGHVESPSSEKMEALANLSMGGMPRPTFSDPPSGAIPETAPEEDRPQPKPPTIKGVGAAYPVNQALAQGKTDGPVSLREGNKMAQQSFSDETVQALKMANQNIKKSSDDAEPEAKPVEPKAPTSVAKEASAELDEAEQTLTPAGQLDFSAIGDLRSMLMSQKRREEIEKRLKPLDIGDMIMKRELTQTIPVIPDKLEVTLRTFSQRENLWILKYIYDFPGSALYIQELINTCRLVCGLVAINGSFFPDHRKDAGQNSETIIKEDFEKKFFHVASFPVQLVADLSVQSLWFQDRVEKLFTVETLKNG